MGQIEGKKGEIKLVNTIEEAIKVLNKPSPHIHVAHKTENGMDWLYYSSDLVETFEMSIKALETIEKIMQISDECEEEYKLNDNVDRYDTMKRCLTEIKDELIDFKVGD